MDILRKTPYPITVEFDVPDANTEYILLFEDSVTNLDLVVNKTSDANSKITYDLEGFFVDYDGSYPVTIYEDNSGEYGDLVLQDNLDIKRPYIDPYTIAPSGEEAKYVKYEKLARAIIDEIVKDGFYYKRSILETVGQGTDYMPLWIKGQKILKAYENTELVWDSDEDPSALKDANYHITRDQTAITKSMLNAAGEQNRHESKQAAVDLSLSDSFNLYDTSDSANIASIKTGVMFPEGWDYIFVLETGYKVVPSDIKQAIEMLIDDLACGQLDYYQRYVTAFSTDQYNMKADKSMLDGTGNLLVDKILERYRVDIERPGVL